MTLTIEEIKDILVARYDPEDIIEILEPDIEAVVDGLHEVICEKQDMLVRLLTEV
jgi:hypothetical protein